MTRFLIPFSFHFKPSSPPPLTVPLLFARLTPKKNETKNNETTHSILDAPHPSQIMSREDGVRVAKRDPLLAIAGDLDLSSAVDLSSGQPHEFNN